MTRWRGPKVFKIGGRLDYITIKDHPLFPQFMKARKRFDLLLKHGYQPFKGLGKNEDGRIEPMIQKHRPHRAGLGFSGKSQQKKTVFAKGAY
jgi:hypothetical protein